MVLAGVPVRTPSTGLPSSSGLPGADDLADRLDQALADDVSLLELTIAERAIILVALEDPADGLAELRAVLLNEHQWRQRTGLDPIDPD